MTIALYETNAGHLYLVADGDDVAYRVDDVDGAQFTSDAADMAEYGTANWNVDTAPAHTIAEWPRTVNGPRHVATWKAGGVTMWDRDRAGYAAREYVGDVEVES